WRRYAYVWLFLAIGASMGSVYTFYFDAVFGVGPFGRGLILALTAALTVVGSIAGGIIGQRMVARGETRRAGDLIAWTIVASAISMLGTAFAPSLGAAVAVVLITTPLRSLAAIPVM